jgi:hypothetical protein
VKSHSNKTSSVITQQKNQKLLDSCQDFFKGMKNEHLSSLKQKVTELLAAKDLAVDGKSGFN